MTFKPFDKVLDKFLEKRGISLRTFATEAGLSAPAVSQIKSGSRPVPTTRVEAWADILKLTGQDRVEFIDAAMWTVIPKRARPWIEGKLAGKRTP